MEKHQFIFTPGVWIGEGKITFSTSPEHVNFYVKWIINGLNEQKKIHSEQQVEMQGVEENTFNAVVFSEISQNEFKISLENHLLGKIHGKGVIDEKTIAWEYRGDPEFEGFELYELQDNGEYSLHAEYTSTDQYRTIIDGRVWKKST